MEGSFHDLEKLASRTIVEGVKSANALPKNHDFDYHLTDDDFARNMDEIAERALQLAGRLVKKELPSCKWDDIDNDPSDFIDMATEAGDAAFERINSNLEALKRGDTIIPNTATTSKATTTAQMAPTTVKIGAWNRSSIRKKGGDAITMMHATNIQRPQLSFPDSIDNLAITPFKPKLTSKPNAKKELLFEMVEPSDSTDDLHPALASHVASMNLGGSDSETFRPYYKHPYQYELDTLEIPEQQLKSIEVQPMPAITDDVTFTWVETPSELEALLQVLKSVNEIAIDLEAHSYRTYQGFCCLMQISTRDQDFIVDTLKLRGELEILNQVFTDPKIVKVMHGADSDVVWLQRDFGLYLVNLFDTGQAMRVLTFPRFSLAYLLNHFCNVQPNKTYQLADWRIRPLPKEMLKYAQEDTHYLLYVYDKLRNQLLESGNEQGNLLKAVYFRSRDVCLKRYEVPVYDPETADKLSQKQPTTLQRPNQLAFRALHAWRDMTAREEDESPRFVLPDHMLFEMANVLPATTTQIFSCCRPVPPLVRVHAHQMLEVIQDAVAGVANDSAVDMDLSLDESSLIVDVQPRGAVHLDDEDVPFMQPKNDQENVLVSVGSASNLAQAFESIQLSNSNKDSANSSKLEQVAKSFTASLLSLSNVQVIEKLKELQENDLMAAQENAKLQEEQRQKMQIKRKAIELEKREGIKDSTKQEIFTLALEKAKEAEDFEKEQMDIEMNQEKSGTKTAADDKDLSSKSLNSQKNGSQKKRSRRKKSKSKDDASETKPKRVPASKVQSFDYKNNKASFLSEEPRQKGGKNNRLKRRKKEKSTSFDPMSGYTESAKKSNGVSSRTVVRSGAKSSTGSIKSKRRR